MAVVAMLLMFLPIYGLLVLAHYRIVKKQQRVLNDSLVALRLVGRKH